MTLAATVARRRNIPEHLALWTQKKSLIIGNTSHFQTIVFREKEFPQYDWEQILNFLTRPNLYGVNRFDFKISYSNDKKA
jgi:hypothetical protein